MTFLNSIYNITQENKKINLQVDQFKDNLFINQQIDLWKKNLTQLKYNYELKEKLVKHFFDWQVAPVIWSYAGEPQQTYVTTINDNTYENTLYTVKDNNINLQNNPVYILID